MVSISCSTVYKESAFRSYHCGLHTRAFLRTNRPDRCVGLILSAPLFAHIADRTGKASTLIYVSLAATLILFVCYPFTHTFLALLTLTLLINALIPATQPLLDRMAITGGPGSGHSYTVIRALGSVGFAILTVALLLLRV